MPQAHRRPSADGGAEPLLTRQWMHFRVAGREMVRADGGGRQARREPGPLRRTPRRRGGRGTRLEQRRGRAKVMRGRGDVCHARYFHASRLNSGGAARKGKSQHQRGRQDPCIPSAGSPRSCCPSASHAQQSSVIPTTTTARPSMRPGMLARRSPTINTWPVHAAVGRTAVTGPPHSTMAEPMQSPRSPAVGRMRVRETARDETRASHADQQTRPGRVHVIAGGGCFVGRFIVRSVECVAGGAVSVGTAHRRCEPLQRALAPRSGDGDGDAGGLDVEEQPAAVAGLEHCARPF
jgi:hypothetical protein